MRSLLILTLIAAAPQRQATALLLVWNGMAAPIACGSPGKIGAPATCAGLFKGSPALRSTSAEVVTRGWDPNRALCPWSDGSEPKEPGAFKLCKGDSCEDESPPRLAILPATSPSRFGVATRAQPSETQLEAMAVTLKTDRKRLQLASAFDVDLDGDRAADRIVTVFVPRKTPHPADLSDPHATFLFLAEGAPVQLGVAGCSGLGDQFLGAIDLDGDHRLEVVMLFQYQAVIYRLDGTIALEGAACCGLG